MDVIIRSDAKVAADTAARAIAKALQANPRLVLGLATGCTMESVYAALVQIYREEGLDFSLCRFFNLDEYVGMAATDPNSYQFYLNHHLFRHINVDPKNIHVLEGKTENIQDYCEKYEELIDQCGGIDMQLLGIGENGHLGFNEPLSAFRSRTRLQALSPVTRAQNARLFPHPDQMPHHAITMGVGTILDCRRCLLLAIGKEKADIVSQAIEGSITSMITATALQLHPDCTVILDKDAGSKLKNLQTHYAISSDVKEPDIRRSGLPMVTNHQ